jgi:MFS transporter, PPP family, 3-phenylpropionic acid transporter
VIEQTRPLTAANAPTDRRIIAFYLLAFAAGGVIQPFLNLYLAEIGLSGAQIGALHGWTALSTILVTPLIGVVADRTQQHRRLLAVIVVIKGLSAALLLLSNAWLWLLLMVGGRVITSQAQDAIMNRLTLAWLKTRGRRDFGAVRFWGALSFAATSLLAGWLARDGSVAVLFPLAGLLGIVAALFVRAFPAQLADRQRDASVVSALSFRPWRSRPRQLLFVFVVIFLFSAGKSGYETFGFVYLKQALGAGNGLIGLLGAVTSLAPLPAYYLADRLVRRRSSEATMALSFVLFAVAALGYAAINVATGAILYSAVYGVAQALFLVSLVLIMGDLGRPEQAATDQMLAQLTVPGLAGVLAQPASGWIFDVLGGRTLFTTGAGVVLVATLLLIGFGRVNS